MSSQENENEDNSKIKNFTFEGGFFNKEVPKKKGKTKKSKGIDFMDYAKDQGIEIKLQYEDSKPSQDFKKEERDYDNNITLSSNKTHIFPKKIYKPQKDEMYELKKREIPYNNESPYQHQTNFNNTKELPYYDNNNKFYFDKNKYNKDINLNNYNNNINSNSNKETEQQNSFLQMNKFDNSLHQYYNTQQDQKIHNYQSLYNQVQMQNQMNFLSNSINQNNINPYLSQMNFSFRDEDKLSYLENIFSYKNLWYDIALRTAMDESGWVDAEWVIAYWRLNSMKINEQKIYEMIMKIGSEVIEQKVDNKKLYLRSKGFELFCNQLPEVEEMKMEREEMINMQRKIISQQANMRSMLALMNNQYNQRMNMYKNFQMGNMMPSRPQINSMYYPVPMNNMIINQVNNNNFNGT